MLPYGSLPIGNYAVTNISPSQQQQPQQQPSMTMVGQPLMCYVLSHSSPPYGYGVTTASAPTVSAHPGPPSVAYLAHSHHHHQQQQQQQPGWFNTPWIIPPSSAPMASHVQQQHPSVLSFTIVDGNLHEQHHHMHPGQPLSIAHPTILRSTPMPTPFSSSMIIQQSPSAASARDHQQQQQGYRAVRTDTDDLNFTRDTPFWFDMLPPPLPFEAFEKQWEINASTDEGGRAAFSRGQVGGMGCGVSTSSTSAAPVPHATSPVQGASCATEDEDVKLMVARYRTIQQRWYEHVSIIEKKAEVRERIRPRRECPSLQDTESAMKDENPSVFFTEYDKMKHWSSACMLWWQGTRRKRARRGRRSGAKSHSSASSPKCPVEVPGPPAQPEAHKQPHIQNVPLIALEPATEAPSLIDTEDNTNCYLQFNDYMGTII